MKRVIVSLSLGVLLLLGLVGCKNEKSEEIRVTGNVEMTEVVVRSKFGGKITEVLVEEGQTVKANALLAKFDDQDIAKQLEEIGRAHV